MSSLAHSPPASSEIIKQRATSSLCTIYATTPPEDGSQEPKKHIGNAAYAKVKFPRLGRASPTFEVDGAD